LIKNGSFGKSVAPTSRSCDFRYNIFVKDDNNTIQSIFLYHLLNSNILGVDGRMGGKDSRIRGFIPTCPEYLWVYFYIQSADIPQKIKC